MALHPYIDTHLKKIVGPAGYTVSGSTATIAAGTNIDTRTLAELIDVGSQAKHDVKLVSSSLTIAPR